MGGGDNELRAAGESVVEVREEVLSRAGSGVCPDADLGLRDR